jgi:hypothetical protein
MAFLKKLGRLVADCFLLFTVLNVILVIQKEVLEYFVLTVTPK